MNEHRLSLSFALASLLNVILNIINHLAHERSDCDLFFYTGISTGLFAASFGLFAASYGLLAERLEEEVV